MHPGAVVPLPQTAASAGGCSGAGTRGGGEGLLDRRAHFNTAAEDGKEVMVDIELAAVGVVGDEKDGCHRDKKAGAELHLPDREQQQQQRW